MHRWFVFITACVVMLVPVGFSFSVGVLFVDFITVFNVSRSKASLVQTVLLAVILCCGLLVGPTMQKFGMLKTGLFGSVLASAGLVVSFFANSISYLVISVGVVTGFGTMFLFIVSNVAVGHYFTTKTALILLSIVNACSGVGGMLFPFILAYLSETFGLRGTLLLCGGILMNTIPGVLLWTQPQQTLFKTRKMKQYSINVNIDEGTRPRTDDISSAENGYMDGIALRIGETVAIEAVNSEENTDQSLLSGIKLLLKDKCFILFAFGTALAYPLILTLRTFVVDIFTDSGLSEIDANFGLLLMNAFAIGGRLLPGLVMQSKYIKALMVSTFASIVTGVSLTGIIVVKSLALKLVFSCIVGIPAGIFVSCINVICLDNVGPSQLGNAAGLTLTLNGLITIAAGPVSGYIRDATGSYLVVFLVFAGVQIIATAVFVSAMFFRKDSKKSSVSATALVVYVTKM